MRVQTPSQSGDERLVPAPCESAPASSLISEAVAGGDVTRDRGDVRRRAADRPGRAGDRHVRVAVRVERAVRRGDAGLIAAGRLARRVAAAGEFPGGLGEAMLRRVAVAVQVGAADRDGPRAGRRPVRAPDTARVARPFVEPTTGIPITGHEEPVSPVEEKSVRPSMAPCSRILSPGTSMPSTKIALALPTFSHSPNEALPCSGPFLSFTQPVNEARTRLRVVAREVERLGLDVGRHAGRGLRVELPLGGRAVAARVGRRGVAVLLDRDRHAREAPLGLEGAQVGDHRVGDAPAEDRHRLAVAQVRRGRVVDRPEVLRC